MKEIIVKGLKKTSFILYMYNINDLKRSPVTKIVKLLKIKLLNLIADNLLYSLKMKVL